MTTSAPAQPLEKFRKDYQEPPFLIDTVELDFQLNEAATVVRADSAMRRGTCPVGEPMRLRAEHMKVLGVWVDDEPLDDSDWVYDGSELVIQGIEHDAFVLTTRVEIKPAENTRLEGLYQSSGNYCTQCEAEGFRAITPFLDRPDVMARYSVRIEADKTAYPVLLSNGNLKDSGDADAGRHWALWVDPFPKPSYLFALVAGDLAHQKDTFQTMNGRNVDLWIWTNHGSEDRLNHAMLSLKKSMKWDEDVFGLEYDLDLYNIVVVHDFNMGAMENKSLNVFNSSLVLARPDTATDLDYERIEGVIAHEYFHNWTGNRVTCKDWFQLTLKEGLTVFRDQEFSSDMGSAAVNRIENVSILRSMQFSQDAGPMAHSIRPDSYVEMNNFYTVTVYNKGSEIIRMYHTLLGATGFRKGMDLYFERHDGGAVTCDDFRAAMADANDFDFSLFENWYAQAGTPTVEASTEWLADAGTFTVKLTQSCEGTPGQDSKKPFHIPVAIGLLDSEGNDLVGTQICELKESQQAFVFEGLSAEPVPSLLRGFSAPIKLRYEQSNKDLAFLMANDSDSFNRWEAGQKLGERVVFTVMEAMASGAEPSLPDIFVAAWGRTLQANGMDRSLQAYALRLPDEATLAGEMDVVDPDALHNARKWVVRTLAETFTLELQAVYAATDFDGAYSPDASSIARRRMHNLALGYLTSLEDSNALSLAQEQFAQASNMTDSMAALFCLVELGGEAREKALQSFYAKWKDDVLVVNKWLAAQAASSCSDTLEQVEALLQHPAFTLKNPNNVRALLRTFSANQVRFHAADGAGYRFLGEQVLALDKLNPQIASRIVAPFSTWKQFDSARQGLMKEQLVRIRDTEGLSKDVWEIVSKSLS